MNCEEFEQILQQQADTCIVPCDDVALRQHAHDCPACRELEEGFRFIAQGFTASRVPAPSEGLTDRIVVAAVRDRAMAPPRMLRPIVWLAAAASFIAAVGLWAWQITIRDVNPSSVAIHSPLPSHHSPNSDEPLFPELADAIAGDRRDGVVLVDAVEPVSEIFRAVGRSLGSPVRPIVAGASEALTNLIKDIPEPDSPMMSMPGMREIMPQPMKKKMGEMGPSSSHFPHRTDDVPTAG